MAKYTVEVLIRNMETGACNIAARTVSVEREKSAHHSHDPLPIDSDQKDSLLRWAIDQAAGDAIKQRDRVRQKPEQFTKRVSSDHRA